MQTLTLADHAETTVVYAALRHIWHEGGGNARVGVKKQALSPPA
jgi:hypothetical protein